MSARTPFRTGAAAVGITVLCLLLVPVRPAHGQEARPAAGAVPQSADVRSSSTLLGEPGDERRIPERLRHRDRAAVVSIAKRLREGESVDAVQDDWSALVRRSRTQDVDELVRWVLREAYTTPDRPGDPSALERTDGEERMASVDLRPAQRKQQQSMQMLSNVSKQLHDTAKAAIRNMK